jgi:hypothetical protein
MQSGATRSNIPGERVKAVRGARNKREAAMSIFSALFGGGKTEKAAEPVEYKGYVIRAAPYKASGHYQTAGTIERDIGGVMREHRFIRADVYFSYEDAVTFTVNKARQIIDLQGEKIFATRA